jgi:hypothetical protein
MIPTLFPDSDLALEGLIKATQTKVFKNHNKKIEAVINSLIDHFSQRPNLNIEKLKEFFNLNDKLDRSRSVYLKDYVPALDKFRITVGY